MPKSTKYKGVYVLKGYNNSIVYTAQKMHNGIMKKHDFKIEREAAIGYDKICIEFGLLPVNILKQKPAL